MIEAKVADLKADLIVDNPLPPGLVLQMLAHQGELLTVSGNTEEMESLRFARVSRGLLGITLTRTETGYTVSVPLFASPDDYELFGVAIRNILTASGGSLSTDPMRTAMDPTGQYGEPWIQMQMKASIAFVKGAVLNTAAPVLVDGFFAPICAGAKLLQDLLRKPLHEIDPTPEAYEELMSYLVPIQWAYTRGLPPIRSLSIQNVSRPEQESRSLSAIFVKDKKVVDFSLIPYADIFAVMDMDHPEKEPFMIPYRFMHLMTASQYFDRVDDLQVVRTSKPLSLRALERMIKIGRRFVPDDLFGRPVYPGCGVEGANRTFILRWDPAISSCEMDEMRDWRQTALTRVWNWSVWDHGQMRMGDKFYLLRVGEGNVGIVASGVFSSHPYQGADWRGTGRRVHYADLDPNFIADPESDAVYPIADLERLLPSYPWNEGHSGVLLPDAEALALEMLWSDHLERLRTQDGNLLFLTGAPAPDSPFVIFSR